MAIRTQIQLTPEHHRRARDRAAALGISLAEYIRRLVAADLTAPRRGADVSEIFGIGATSETISTTPSTSSSDTIS